MKYVGIALIIAQLAVYFSVLTEPSLKGHGFGWPLFGIAGVIILIIYWRKKIRSNKKIKYDEDD